MEGIYQPGALFPIFRRPVYLDHQPIRPLPLQNPPGLAGKRVGSHRVSERKPIFWIESVLVLGRSTAGHRKTVVGKHLASTGDVSQQTIEHASAMSVIVHPELDEMPQETTCL